MQITRSSFLKGLAGVGALGGLRALGIAETDGPPGGPGNPPAGERIVEVEVGPFVLPQRVEAKVALGPPLVSDNVLVRLRTDGGTTGLGESSPYSPVTGETSAVNLALAPDLARIVRGRDPFTIPLLIDEMDAFAPGNPGIKAAFETALWDICGKLSGLPVHRMLGTFRTTFETDRTVFLDEPEVMAERSRDLVARLGFRSIKVKVGESPELDDRRLAAVRAAVGDEVRLWIDANQGWTPAQATRALALLARHRLVFCEQPVAAWDWEGMKHVRDRAPVPIMADESVHTPRDAIDGIRLGAMDMVNIKLLKSGGILNSVRIAQIADAAGLPCMVGSMSESRIALTAAAHVVASQRNIVYADLDSFLSQGLDPVIGGMTVHDGMVTVPDTPGLGVDLEDEYLGSLRLV